MHLLLCLPFILVMLLMSQNLPWFMVEVLTDDPKYLVALLDGICTSIVVHANTTGWDVQKITHLCHQET